ncbi:type IV pilin [Halostella pelagica]|uniref:type IV pilin n=1 Tax=Halostella pelagica TaxID=2583824 RepID=UPI0010803AE1|nr:type IV pilin N-terminal domain-containing protein [Halostella pelagica]
MDLKELFTDDDAVSPVIGVILMVAITVILAAVIGAFVLDLGGNTQETPQASFNFDQSSGPSVTISHESGDSLQEGNIDVTVEGEQAQDGTGSAVWDGSGEIAAGDAVTVENRDDGTGTSTGIASDETIRIIWGSDSGDSSSTLQEYEIK